MNITIENKVYDTRTAEGWEETNQAFAQLDNHLNGLLAGGNVTIQQLTHEESGDMHSGNDITEDTVTLTEPINTKELFKVFINCGDFNYHIEVNPEQTKFTIQTVSTYNLSSCWLDKRVEFVVQ